jgi:hypothetical protein
VPLVAFADDEPRGDIECSKQRGRAMPHIAVVRRSGTPGIIGKTGCAYRKSSPSILVMQSIQDRTAQNAPRGLGGTRYRRVLVQR